MVRIGYTMFTISKNIVFLILTMTNHFFSIVIPCCWEDEGVELALACMNLSIFGPLSRIYILFFLHGSPHLVAILVYPREL